MKGILILAIITASFNLGCFQLYDCGEEVIREVPSPDNKYKATLFERNCGATTGFVPHINLRESDKEFKKDDLDTISEGYIKTPDSIENLVINWENNKTLKIKCPTCDSIKNTSWNDVNILYSK